MHKDYMPAIAAGLTAAAIFSMLGYYAGTRLKGAVFSVTGTDSGTVYTLTEAEIAAQDSIDAQLEQKSEDSTPNIVGRININTADTDTLCLLPGIGEAKAAAIIEYREEYGAFSSVDELLDVPGIGDSVMAQIIDYITVGEENWSNENTGS